MSKTVKAVLRSPPLLILIYLYFDSIMAKRRLANNDTVHQFMSELTSSVVAKSGQPSDRYHLGKLIFESLKRYPDRILQIDGATDQFETNASVLKRSVQCAVAMRSEGLVLGDVIVLLSPNHLDVTIPLYSALYLGVVVSTVDQNLEVNELKWSFDNSRPKVVFCQKERALDVENALKQINCNAKIVTFDKGNSYCGFTLDQYNAAEIEEFEPSNFDAENAIALLIATSGTTGLPKAAAATHKGFVINMPYLWARYREFPTPTRMTLNVSSLQWLTSLINFLGSAIFGFTRLQVSTTPTVELCAELIRKYKVTWALFSPPFATSLFRQEGEFRYSNFKSLETVAIGGSAVSTDLGNDIKRACSEGIEVMNGYGISEITGLGFTLETVPGSCGRPLGCWDYRLINLETGKDTLEANIPGELWIKGPALFKGYYRNPEATKEAMVEDEWFRTGDIFYRNENDYYFFVDRIKLLLKYKNNQISPVEVENVIRTHRGVLDVAVTGIQEDESGDLAVACVVPKLGVAIDAEEIKQLVKENLSDSKQLRGGVIIMAALPMTISAKVDRKKLKEMVKDMKRL